MSNKKHLLALVALVAAAVCSATRLHAQDQVQHTPDITLCDDSTPQVSLKLSSETGVGRLGQPVIVKCVAANITDHAIMVPSMNPSRFGSHFHLDVFDVNGKRAQLLHPLPENPQVGDLPIGSVRAPILDKGETTYWAGDITTIYKLDQPGPYTVQAWFDRANAAVERSNTITITIEP
jgi:hypothetical protein